MAKVVGAIAVVLLFVFVLFVFGLWFTLGGGHLNLANWFWSSSDAPWEAVDAFYYPDRNDRIFHLVHRDVGRYLYARW